MNITTECNYKTLSRDIYEPYEERCLQFATLSDNSSGQFYADKRAAPRNKIFYDIYWGKLSEFAIWSMLSKFFNIELTEPDTEIYTVRNKNYDPDLTGSMLVEVKSCSKYTTDNYGTSWAFTNTNRDFGEWKPEGWIALVETNPDHMKFYGFLHSSYLESQLKDPKLLKHHGHKKFIYLRGVEHLLVFRTL